MLVLVLMCSVPAVAQAGTYEVWTCAGPHGEPIAADGWAPEGGASFSSNVNACGSGGGLFSGLNGDFDHPVGTQMSWHFAAPANTRIASYRIWRAAVVGASQPYETPVYTMARGQNVYDGAYLRENCPGTGCSGQGSTATPLAAGNLVTEDNLTGVRDIWLNASCGGGGGSFCRASAGTGPYTSAFWMYRAAIVLRDDADPAFSAPPTGTLLGGGALAGAHGVSVAATDSGGGLLEAAIEVDGQRVASNAFGCAPPFTQVVPCKLAASTTVQYDTAALADGAHSVRVLVTDASGNTAAYGPVSITTSNAPSSCAAAAAPDLTTRVSRRGSIGYGGRLLVHGQLAGAPAGTQVRLLSQVAQAGAAQKMAQHPLVTDAQGRFTYRVPAGPSRTLRFAYRNASDPFFLCSKAVAVKVRAPVSLRATPRAIRSGQRVRFRGRLRGGYVPPQGKLVELQAFERGRWRNLRNVRTNARGEFSYRYRFSFRARGVTFPVRVRVRPDAGYPWAVGTSNRVSVRVR
jgi:hypothetical protein